jgi:hypothetical protein
MRVIPVAIGASAVSDGNSEVAGPVTGLAGQAFMFPYQGEIGGRVIE